MDDLRTIFQSHVSYSIRSLARLDQELLVFRNSLYPLREDFNWKVLGLVVTLGEVLGNLIPQSHSSIRAFVHANNSLAADLQQFLHFFQDLLSVLNCSNLLQHKSFKTLKSCINQAIYQIFLEILFAHFFSCTVVIIFLFEYLMGYIERGGWATYADTSWEFRATYVAIELRLAAYFWFKFRAWPTPASSLETGRKRSRAELIGTPSVSDRNQRNKFEPRLKAYVQNGDNKMNPVWLGEYDSRYEAEVVFWIGAYYYDRWDRFNDGVYPRCMAINLPLLPPNLSVEGKKAWVREQAKVSLTRRHQDPGASVEHYQAGSDVPVMLSGAVEERSQEGSVTEPHQGAGFGDLVTESRTVEEEGLPPIDDSLQCPPPPPSSGDIEFMLEEFMRGGLQQPDSTGIDISQRDLEDVSVDDYILGSSSTPDVASGHSVGNEGQNSLGTCWDQEGVQHLQQNHEQAMGGDVPEVGPILQQDETEGHHRPSANHMQAVPSPGDAPELEMLTFTDTILSTSQELYAQGWGFRTLPRHSTEFSVAFSRCEGRQRPLLTGPITSAFKEIHGQGFEIILEPIGNSSTQCMEQDGNGKAQSRADSRDLCRNCQARLCRNCKVAE